MIEPKEQLNTDKVFHAFVPCPDCDGRKPLPHPVEWSVALNDPDICQSCRGWGLVPFNHTSVLIERLLHALDKAMGRI